MVKSGFFISSVLFTAMASSSVFADFLVQDAIVTFVNNTTNNSYQFSIVTSGGTGPCNATAITFSSTDSDIQDRAYQAALTALTEGMRVDVFDYDGTDCSDAAHIALKK